MDKKKINFIFSVFIFLIGILLFISSFLEFMKPSTLLYIVFSLYGGLKLIEFILTRKEGDLENLYTFIACTLVAISGYKFASYSDPKVLGITLFCWVGVMSIIKLIKLDYYHDRKDKMFFVNLLTFSLFLLLGLLTSINLYYEQTIQFLMLGFFFVINGILSMAETGIIILLKNKQLKIK